MFPIRLVLLMLTTLLALAPATARAQEPPSRPAGLAVVVFNPRGLAIDAVNPYAVPGGSFSAGWIGGMGGQIAQEINNSINERKRRAAIGPEWEALDHDALDARLHRIAMCHVDRSRLAADAKIKEMKDFGPSMAMFLSRYTPGVVVVYDVRMGLTSELDRLYFSIEESVLDFRRRAKSKRELKRIPKDEQALHRPTVLSTVAHQFIYSPLQEPARFLNPGQGDLGTQGHDSSTAPPAEVIDISGMTFSFDAMGQLWRADGSALLLSKIEEGFAFLEKSERPEVADCLRASAAGTQAD